MAGIRTLAGDTVIYGLSTIVTRMLNYLLTPYLTRVMATGEYGVITDLYSLIPFALVLLTMGLESGYFRFAGKAADEGEKNKLFVTLWGATIAAAVMFGVLAVMFRSSVSEVLGYGDSPDLVTLTAVIVALDVITSMPFARLREQRKRIKYVLIRFASVVVNVALCLFLYSVQQQTGAAPALMANLVASGAALALLLPTVWNIPWRASGETLKKVMVYSLPLLVSGIAGTAGEFIDRQMVKWLMPPDVAMDALGVYGATTKLAVIMILFTQMYRMAAEPFFLARFGKGEFARQSGLAMKLYIAVAVAIFAVVMIAKPLVVLIVGEEFRGGSELLPILLAANALAGVVLNLSFWYKQAERTWMAIAVTGTGLAVAVALNVVLVPRLGYEGAAWARLACEAAMVAVSWILVSRIKRDINVR
jgi:O-antigen/teichoic acid export membrane protein